MCKLAFMAETVILVLESKPPDRCLRLLLERHFLICPYLFRFFLYRAKCRFFFFPSFSFPQHLYYFCQSLNGIFCVVSVLICHPRCLSKCASGARSVPCNISVTKIFTVFVCALHKVNFGSVTKASDRSNTKWKYEPTPDLPTTAC